MSKENKEIVRYGLASASLAFFYIILIASFLTYIPSVVKYEVENSVLVPIIMLSLLVLSVAIMGTLIFGRPVLWYLDGKKGEAVRLLLGTIVFFFIYILIILLVVLFTV